MWFFNSATHFSSFSLLTVKDTVKLMLIFLHVTYFEIIKKHEDENRLYLQLTVQFIRMVIDDREIIKVNVQHSASAMCRDQKQ
jgi:hypothetical protein